MLSTVYLCCAQAMKTSEKRHREIVLLESDFISITIILTTKLSKKC